MERRDFLKKTAIVAAAAAVAPQILNASESWSPASQAAVGSDFSIISNTVKGGVRTVVGAPSSLVCAKQITLEINAADSTIISCKFKGGCPGNAKGISALIVGMKVSDVIARLKGIDCAGRGTSCPDQLSKILQSI